MVCVRKKKIKKNELHQENLNFFLTFYTWTYKLCEQFKILIKMLNKRVIAQHEVIEMAYNRKREPILKKKKEDRSANKSKVNRINLSFYTNS